MPKEVNQPTSKKEVKERKTTQPTPESESKLYGKYSDDFFEQLCSFSSFEDYYLDIYGTTIFNFYKNECDTKIIFQIGKRTYIIQSKFEESSETQYPFIQKPIGFFYTNEKGATEVVTTPPEEILGRMYKKLFFRRLKALLSFEDKSTGVKGTEVFEVKENKKNLTTRFKVSGKQLEIQWEHKPSRKHKKIYYIDPKGKLLKIARPEIFLKAAHKQLRRVKSIEEEEKRIMTNSLRRKRRGKKNPFPSPTTAQQKTEQPPHGREFKMRPRMNCITCRS